MLLLRAARASSRAWKPTSVATVIQHKLSGSAAAANAEAPDCQDEPDEAALRGALLQAALAHVPRLGWSRAALVASCCEAGLSPAAAGLFPRGGADLALHAVAASNAALAAELQRAAPQLAGMPVRRRIAWAVRRRLELNGPYIADGSWPQALSLLAAPGASGAALGLLAQLLDDIWYAAGDTSTDASWYSKRALLAAVYTSSELFMIADFSPGWQDTWAQLERRIEDVLWLGSAARSAAALPQQLLNALLAAAGAPAAAPPAAAAAEAAPQPQPGAREAAAAAQQQQQAAAGFASSSSDGQGAGARRE